MSRVLEASFLVVLVASATGCGAGDAPARDTGADAADATADAGPTDADVAADVAPPQPTIAEALGITQYVGAIEPIEESRDGDETVYTFDPEQGPLCMRGAEFRASVRDSGSEDLVIFLQGGGACWSEFCLAVTGAPGGVPGANILDPELEANPTRDWNAVYLPYCDGSFFAGDAEHDDNINDNGTRIHRGLANLTGALEVAADRFPSPRRILLAGSSGGAYGLLLAGPLVRHYYPDAELIVMADSGIGLARHGDPDYIQLPVDEFDVARFIPDDCERCITSGHLTGVISWFLDRDDNVRVGLFSSWYDSVLSRTFLQVPAAQFAEGLRVETDAVHAAHPDRFRRFIIDGTQHTTLLDDVTGIVGSDLTAIELPPGAFQDLLGGDLVIGGMESTAIGELTMGEWLGAMIENDLGVWVDVQEEPSPPPEDRE